MVPLLLGLGGVIVLNEMTKKKPDEKPTTEKREVSEDYVNQTLRKAGKKLSVKR